MSTSLVSPTMKPTSVAIAIAPEWFSQKCLILDPLPNEITACIFRYFDATVLMRLAAVNTAWRKLSLSMVVALKSVPYYTSHLLLPQMPNLRKLHMNQFDFMPKSIFMKLTNLTSLCVFGHTHINDEILACLTSLEKLEMRECYNVTGRGVGKLANLRVLKLYDMGPIFLPRDASFPALKKVSLVHVDGIDEVGLGRIAPRIQVVDYVTNRGSFRYLATINKSQISYF